MTDKIKASTSEITAENVQAYLREHPDFFTQHPTLLSELTLPHPSGEAVSLVERQVSLLRERNTQMKERHTHLLENARENDRLFDKSKRLVLALVEANDLDDLVDALYYSFEKEFNIEFYKLILFGNTQKINSSAAGVTNLHTAKDALGKRMSSSRAITGGVSAEEKAFLFDADASKVGSAAFSVLNNGTPIGVLAVGNSDEKFYHSGMGTLFLSYIAEVLNRLIPTKLNAK